MFYSLKSKIFLGGYILLLLAIPVGSYLISQQQTLTSKAAPPKTTKLIVESPIPAPSPTSRARLASPSPEPSMTTTTSFGPTLSGKVALEGRSVNNQTGKLFVGILENLVNNPTFLLSFTVDLPATGEFNDLSLAGLSSGRNYYAVLKGPSQIATSSAFTISPNVTRLNGGDPIILTSGDLNEDNTVTTADYDLAKLALVTWNELADLNKDGVVNLLDLGIISKNLGKVGATGVWVSAPAKATGGPVPSGTGYWIFVPNL
ncbi:hypothetical protein HYU96_00035 [Candidatus Daviesbacteria bacterium]|nr:hypothetical protein [Candidatus Daviesbacteria bacterium]